MDPPAVDKYLSRPTSTSSSRLWRSSKNAPVTGTGTVKGEMQRLNYRCYCSQNGQNKTFLHRATAASPQQHRRMRGLQQGANGLFRTLIISIIFVILSLLKLAPLAHNSVQVEDHKSEIDLPPQLRYHLSKETVIKVLIIATRPSSADRVRAICVMWRGPKQWQLCFRQKSLQWIRLMGGERIIATWQLAVDVDMRTSVIQQASPHQS
eukprot:scaffold7377_cov78-Skeletonema_dohrnii-CCMP3373.AAC.1